MITTLVRLHGRINERGELKVTLPEGLLAGDVIVALQREMTAAENGH
jgi:hypothetical protein